MKRRSIGMGLLAGLSLVTVGAITGCSSGGGKGGGDPVEVGQLSLPLSTHGPSGTEYRLRDAVFQVSSNYYNYDYVQAGGGANGGDGSNPYPTTTVSSEDDPAADSINVDVERGYYNVSLRPGWRMEKIEGGVATPVEATLLSDPTQWIYVYPHTSNWIEFQFGLGDRALWFNGQVTIGVQVYETPEQYYGYNNGYGGAGPVPGGYGGAVDDYYSAGAAGQ